MTQIVSAGLVAGLISCSNLFGPGTGSDTPNSICGTIISPTSLPNQQAIVQLLPDSYDPVRNTPPSPVFIDTTGTDGYYQFDRVPAGTWVVSALQQSTGARALIRGVVIADKNMVRAPTDTLRKPGSIKIIIDDSIKGTTRYFYIPGTTRFTLLNPASPFVLIDSVPATVVPSVNFNGLSDLGNRVVRAAVPVYSNDTTILALSSGQFSHEIYLNTTVSGAATSRMVTNFPVHIRLTAANFDFSEADSLGADLKFVKSDGTPMAHEIESWDPAKKRASIWVKVDTVLGNNDTQHFRMLWGTPGRGLPSSDYKVFDTNGGFLGVWHLGGQGNAASQRHNGVSYGTMRVEGLLGPSRQFSGSDSIRVTGLLDSMQTLTVSTWVKVTCMASANGADIVSIGNAVVLRADNGDNGTIASLYRSNGWGILATGQNISKTGWHHIAFSVDGPNNRQLLYIDGVLTRSSFSADPINYKNQGSDTYFGAHGNGLPYYNLIGILDETRICKTARSTEWIKLCYSNQKEVDDLVDMR